MISKIELVEEVDVVVVGAGFAGLSAAKTYLLCAPETNLVTLDANPSLGGTWSKERLYPGVRTNNLYGTFEFPDFPFHERYGVKKGEHIPGHAVFNYLSDFCENFKIAPTLRLNSRARTAEKMDDGRWRLEVLVTDYEPSRPTSYTLICSKLILATGLTSQPEAIHVDGQENFSAPLINSYQLAKEGVEVIEQTPIDQRHITVVGGGKSAYDAVYMFASNGFQVNWIIRKSGHGPTWMAPAYVGEGPKASETESTPLTRALTWFSPCLLGRQNSYASNFLHGTNLGNKLVSAFYDAFSSAIISQTGLNDHPEVQKLVPEEKIFWYATSLAIFNYERNIHDFIKNGQVHVYREDIKNLSQKRVNLADGTQLASPAGIVTATAWKYAPSIDIQPESLRAELGTPGSQYTPEQASKWTNLINEADKYICHKFPMLAQGPSKYPPKKMSTNSRSENGIKLESSRELGPYRLFRFLAPPELTANTTDRSIAFLGYAANLTNHTRNELSALWIYAYMNNKLDILDNPTRPDSLGNSPEKIMQDTALQSHFWKLRYPWGFGNRFPDITFEQVAYNDLLLTDLGLDWRRKKGWFWWIREFIEPYNVADYRGVAAEWIAKNR